MFEKSIGVQALPPTVKATSLSVAVIVSAMAGETISTGTDDLLASLDEGTLTLTLNRPKALHALTLPMCHAMSAALTEWASDDDLVDRAEGFDTKPEPKIGPFQPIPQRDRAPRSGPAPQGAPGALSEEAKAEIRAKFGE